MGESSIASERDPAIEKKKGGGQRLTNYQNLQLLLKELLFSEKLSPPPHSHPYILVEFRSQVKGGDKQF